MGLHGEARGDRVHRAGHVDVLHRNTFHVMRGQRHAHLVVDVEPFWVMVAPLRHEGDLGYEAEGLGKVLEEVLALQRAAALRRHFPLGDMGDETLGLR